MRELSDERGSAVIFGVGGRIASAAGFITEEVSFHDGQALCAGECKFAGAQMIAFCAFCSVDIEGGIFRIIGENYVVGVDRLGITGDDILRKFGTVNGYFRLAADKNNATLNGGIGGGSQQHGDQRGTDKAHAEDGFPAETLAGADLFFGLLGRFFSGIFLFLAVLQR